MPLAWLTDTNQIHDRYARPRLSTYLVDSSNWESCAGIPNWKFHTIGPLKLSFPSPTETLRNLLSSFILSLFGRVINWKSVRQDCLTDPTTDVKYKNVTWLKKFLSNLVVVPAVQNWKMLFCDNNGIVSLRKKPRHPKWWKPNKWLRWLVDYGGKV